MTESTVVNCWWCKTPKPVETLLHLEGARLVGSPPLALPERIPLEERRAMMICHPCARSFAIERHKWDLELAEIGLVRSGAVDGSDLVAVLAELEIPYDRIERLHGATVADAVRRYISEKENR